MATGACSREAAAKVLVGNNDVTGLYALHKRGIQVLQAMLGKLCRIDVLR